MRRLLLLVPALALFAAACGTSSDIPLAVGAGDAAGDTGITVSGEGRVQGTPDVLTVTLGVSVLRDSVSTAIADAASLADGLIATVKELGVEDKDVQTTDFSVYPEYDYTGNQQLLRGYRVNNSLSVKIRDLDRAGEIIDAATVAAGDEVTVSGVAFSLEDNQELVQAAREEAWLDAESKARQLAGLAGVEIGAPISIQETFSSNPPPVFFAEERAFAADVASPIQAGQLSVTVNVVVRFAVGS